MSVGTKNRVAFSVAEAAFGTAAAIAGAKAWPFQGQRPVIKPTFATDADSLIGQMEWGREKVVQAVQTQASFTFDFRLDCLAYWLFRMLGADTVTGIGPYTHQFTLIQTDIPSFTTFWVDANTTAGDVEQFPGCKVSKLTISGKGGGKLTIKVDIIGNGTHAQVANAMVANNTDIINPFSTIGTYNIGGTLNVATMAAPTGGTNYMSPPVLDDFEIMLESMFEPNNEYVAGQTSLSALERLGLKVTGKGTHKWTENGLAGLMAIIEAATPESLYWAMASGANSAAIALPKAFFDDDSVQGQRNVLKKPFTFEGFYDDTTALAIKAQVINGTASYT